MGECVLYGGWLVQINDLKEYNCLLRYGAKEFKHEWFWTDGKSVDEVWTHATDGTDVSFFPPRIGCGANISNKGDAFIFHLGGNSPETPERRGNYCDEPSSYPWKFICEAEI